MGRNYLSVGVVLQMPDQTGPQLPNIVPNLDDVVPEPVQLGDHDLVTVGLPVPMPAADQRPGNDNDQDTDGADGLGQLRQIVHYSPTSNVKEWSPAIADTRP